MIEQKDIQRVLEKLNEVYSLEMRLADGKVISSECEPIIKIIRQLLAEKEQLASIVCHYETFEHIDDYHEDEGCVLFWKLPVVEPPYCGTPNDTGFLEGYYTHWTPIVRDVIIHKVNEEALTAAAPLLGEG